ncbi:hypothetical protein SK128_008340, partial [Halocaridina rubra]
MHLKLHAYKQKNRKAEGNDNNRKNLQGKHDSTAENHYRNLVKKTCFIKLKYECGLCEETLANESQLDSHIEFHYNETRQTEMSRFNVMITKGSDDANMYKCKICHEKFKMRCKLKLHMVKHSECKEYKCSVCNKDYKYKKNLRTHMNRVHGEYLVSGSQGDQTTKKELKCKEMYGSKCDVKVHRKTAHGKTTLVRNDKESETEQRALYRRLKYIRITKNVYDCNICKERIKLDELSPHAEKHIGLHSY